MAPVGICEESGSRPRQRIRMLGWRRSASAKGSFAFPALSRRDFRIAEEVALRPAAARRWRRSPPPPAARAARARLPCFLRAHVVPSNEHGDRLSIVDCLNGHGGGGRMERAPRLHDLSDDRKAGRRRGCEARGPPGKVDRMVNVLGDDEVGVARPAAPRERDDEVSDRPSLLVREAVGERRHRRAVEPCAHRPEDILAGRPSPEGPALREVCCAYRLPQFIHQRWGRRSVAPTEVTVAL